MSWVSSVPLVLVRIRACRSKNVKELVALAKKRAGQTERGSNGSGTTSHLSIEMLKQMRGRRRHAHPLQGRRSGDQRR